MYFLTSGHSEESKITNDGLTRSGTGCFTAVPVWQQWASMDENVSGPADIRRQSVPDDTAEAQHLDTMHRCQRKSAEVGYHR